MTPETAFECVLVSHDPAVFCAMDRIRRDFSIHTHVCPNPSIAANLLAGGGTDLIVIDLEAEHCADLIHQIFESGMHELTAGASLALLSCARATQRALPIMSNRDQNDHREYASIHVSVPIEIQTDAGGSPIRGVTADLSLSGCYIETIFPFAIGTNLDLQLSIETIVLITATAVTCDPQVGNGISFIRMLPEDREALEAFLQAAQQAPGLRLPGVELSRTQDETGDLTKITPEPLNSGFRKPEEKEKEQQ